jgi:hypothetical protein
MGDTLRRSPLLGIGEIAEALRENGNASKLAASSAEVAPLIGTSRVESLASPTEGSLTRVHRSRPRR